MSQHPRRVIWQYLVKLLYIFLFFDSAIQLLQIYSEDIIPTIENICTRLFIAAFFVIIFKRKQPSYPFIGHWLNKLYIHHNKVYAIFNIKGGGFTLFCKNKYEDDEKIN